MSVLPLTYMHNDMIFYYVDILIQYEGWASLME